MTTYLEMRWGGGGKNPPESELLEALAQMNQRDPEHPDCWLVDENGWCLAFNEDGRIVFENSEGDGAPKHLPGATQNMIMEMWRLLQGGQLDKLHSYPWKDGYK